MALRRRFQQALQANADASLITERARADGAQLLVNIEKDSYIRLKESLGFNNAQLFQYLWATRKLRLASASDTLVRRPRDPPRARARERLRAHTHAAGRTRRENQPQSQRRDRRDGCADDQVKKRERRLPACRSALFHCDIRSSSALQCARNEHRKQRRGGARQHKVGARRHRRHRRRRRAVGVDDARRVLQHADRRSHRFVAAAAAAAATDTAAARRVGSQSTPNFW